VAVPDSPPVQQGQLLEFYSKRKSLFGISGILMGLEYRYAPSGARSTRKIFSERHKFILLLLCQGPVYFYETGCIVVNYLSIQFSIVGEVEYYHRAKKHYQQG